MPTQGGRVGAQQPGALCGFDAISLGTEERRQRSLGIHDQALVPGQADHHVWTHSPLVAAYRADLLLEVAASQHAGVLQDSTELDLAPVAADRRGIQ